MHNKGWRGRAQMATVYCVNMIRIWIPSTPLNICHSHEILLLRDVEGRNKKTHGAHWPDNIGEMMSSRFRKGTCFKRK